MDKLSIVVPIFNEEKLVGRLCEFLSEAQRDDDRIGEIVFVDGQSTDQSKTVISNFGFDCIVSKIRSRAGQMNVGAEKTNHNILYFIHADVLPPKSFIDDIFIALDEGFDFGCFSYRFDSPSTLLKINAKFTRRDSSVIGGGDQTLFIKRSVFESLGGFQDDHIIMEDYELFWRAKKLYKYKLIPNDALVSARKYQQNSYLKVQLVNLIVFNGYRLGINQQRLKSWYGKWLRSS